MPLAATRGGAVDSGEEGPTATRSGAAAHSGRACAAASSQSAHASSSAGG